MTSSMTAGERRWGQRRPMTVLGKVAVPKPLNLPSQRLENHGLDPNVEIVPKGTVSWGSRSSSSATNAWGSSSLSPNADGSVGSPSYFSGRPSSGGSSTRPSTADSERTHEPTANAWGPNSRPLSASGVLTSSQTLQSSSRPRSAETRPRSSQLSRFAGPPSDNSVAWGSSNTSEKLGALSAKNNEFALSSGDFPTLGSEKDNSGRNIESQDHGADYRPGSSSGGVAKPNDRNVTSPGGDVSVNSHVKSTTVNTWRRDSSQHVDDVVQPSLEKWQGDAQPFINANVPPQQFDAWHGPPMNAPTGVWFRGPPGGPPYGPPLGPGGFPLEPFPYYHPQIPPTALASSQANPLPGSGPRGPHPRGGDNMYRPHGADAFVRPGMPIRPGFYPGPVAYDGYYGPPMGYCNSNERDIPIVGMAAGHSGYNRYSGNAPDPNNKYGRSSGHGSPGKPMVLGHVESAHHDDKKGPYRVLLKQNNEWEGKEDEGKGDESEPADSTRFEKGDHLRKSSWKTDGIPGHRKDEETYRSGASSGEDVHLQTFDNREGSGNFKQRESRGNPRAVDDNLANKSGNIASSFQVIPQESAATPYDSTLIQKIEGLNAKARTSDGRHDVTSISGSEGQKSRSQVNAMVNHSLNVAVSGAVYNERIHGDGVLPAYNKTDGSTKNKILQPAGVGVTTIPRRESHGVQGRHDHHAKRSNAQDAEGWRKKPLAAESKDVVSTADSVSALSVDEQERHTFVESLEKSGVIVQEKDDGESSTPMSDSSDLHTQRAKMREIAKQRAKQLQKEEEERIREQKAKALAKLEELNRRIQAADGPIEKLENISPSEVVQKEIDESSTLSEEVMAGSKSGTLSSALFSKDNLVSKDSNSGACGVGESSTPSSVISKEKLGNARRESMDVHGESLRSQQDAHIAGAGLCKAAPLISSSSDSGHKHYKQKQHTSSQKNLTEKSIPVCKKDPPKNHVDQPINTVASTEVVAGEFGPGCESSTSISPSVVVEVSAQQKRKNSRSGKSKQRLEDAPTVTGPSPLLKETISFKASELELDPNSVQSLTDANNAGQPSKQRLSSEEAHSRSNTQGRSQHTRRLARAPQALRSADKFHGSDAVIWAPVRSLNKPEVNDEASPKTLPDVIQAVKYDNSVHNSHKNKRAEMERYVPKPVAKELAQQGSSQPTSSSINQTTAKEDVGRSESKFEGKEGSSGSAIVNVGASTESKNGEGKQSKPSKAHTSWRQRAMTESASAQGLQDVLSFSSNSGKDVQECVDQPQSMISDSVKAENKVSDDGNFSDGWTMPEYPEPAVPIPSHVVKEQGANGRGKRHAYKGHRSMGNNHDRDHRNTNSGNTDRSYGQSAVEVSQTEMTGNSKDRGPGDRTSHWQPKSQVYTAHNRGSRSTGGQNVTEVNRAAKKYFPLEGGADLPPQHDKESRQDVAQSKPDQTLSGQKNVTEAPEMEQLEVKKDRKAGSAQLNQGTTNTDEQASRGIDAYHKQYHSSGYRRNGNQNSRSGRGHESGGDWSSAGQDSKHHNVPANRERQRPRQNLQYEYQPVGPYGNSKSNSYEGSTGGSHNMGPKYRERGQGPSRRGGGNFYGRQSSTVDVDAGYD